MAKAESRSNRLPRGTKPVAQAFIAALDTIPQASRAAVARAAQALIRDELKARREGRKPKSLASKGISSRGRGGAHGNESRARKPAINAKPVRRGRTSRLDAGV